MQRVVEQFREEYFESEAAENWGEKLKDKKPQYLSSVDWEEFKETGEMPQCKKRGKRQEHLSYKLCPEMRDNELKLLEYARGSHFKSTYKEKQR